MRVWFNGRTSAFQAEYVGSIPITRLRDSGVVGNARPCQGRDRGFEPRLSLSYEHLKGEIIEDGFSLLRAMHTWPLVKSSLFLVQTELSSQV